MQKNEAGWETGLYTVCGMLLDHSPSSALLEDSMGTNALTLAVSISHDVAILIYRRLREVLGPDQLGAYCQRVGYVVDDVRIDAEDLFSDLEPLPELPVAMD